VGKPSFLLDVGSGAEGQWRERKEKGGMPKEYSTKLQTSLF